MERTINHRTKDVWIYFVFNMAASCGQLLISFLPLGIWFLQPRINGVLAKHRLEKLELQQPIKTHH
jgi:hypothetical protein